MVRRACQRRLAGVSRVAFMSVLGRPMLVVASSLFLGACSQPTQPVTAEPLADSTSASSTQHGGADKARLASDLGLTEPPEVAPVRHITPRESQEVYTGCLQDAGWGESGPDEGIEIPAGQQESFNLAYYVCLQQYPVEEKYTQPLTTERLGVLYDWWVQHTVPCFEQQGWDVGEIPTREAFLANPQWLPTERVAEQAGADVKAGRIATMDEALYGVCAGPPDEVLYP